VRNVVGNTVLIGGLMASVRLLWIRDYSNFLLKATRLPIEERLDITLANNAWLDFFQVPNLKTL